MICGVCKEEIGYTDHDAIKFHLNERCLHRNDKKYYGQYIDFALTDTLWPQGFWPIVSS